MLDGMPLSTKLKVAFQWFQRSRAGEFDLDGRQSETFARLLDDCQEDAVKFEAALLAPPAAPELLIPSALLAAATRAAAGGRPLTAREEHELVIWVAGLFEETSPLIDVEPNKRAGGMN